MAKSAKREGLHDHLGHGGVGARMTNRPCSPASWADWLVSWPVRPAIMGLDRRPAPRGPVLPALVGASPPGLAQRQWGQSPDWRRWWLRGLWPHSWGGPPARVDNQSSRTGHSTQPRKPRKPRNWRDHPARQGARWSPDWRAQRIRLAGATGWGEHPARQGARWNPDWARQRIRLAGAPGWCDQPL